MTVESRLVGLENELKALKMTAPVSIGALQYPNSTPTVHYTGSINTGGMDLVVARLEVTFTRSDGQQITPMVDFAYETAISPNYQQYRKSQGINITGKDPNVADEFYVRCYEAATTDDSVVVFVDVLNAIAPYAGASATLEATVQAISTVEVTLALRIVI